MTRAGTHLQQIQYKVHFVSLAPRQRIPPCASSEQPQTHRRWERVVELKGLAWQQLSELLSEG